MIATLSATVAPTTASAAPIPGPDGLSVATAAASCWEIKQLTPAAPSGVYWLNTPALSAPTQFYCDQTTSGGGWLLIGRGREGWSETREGAGTPAQVSSTITGTAAFAPKQLSSTVINQLLNNQPVTSMTDGIRVRRATNISGTTFQESTFTTTSPFPTWDWMFDNQRRVGAWNIGGVSGTGGTTTAFGSGNSLNTIVTTTNASKGNYRPGWGFGSSTTGSTSATSYLWAPTSTAGYARPFTQVYLRPKLMSSSVFSAIPDSGTTARAQQQVATSFAAPTTWGVAGLGAGPNTVEGSNEVSAFAESNGVVYVGGNFTTVQQTSTGTGAVAQAYLAAFNVNTGAWISTFRPTFNMQVKALAILPNGNLAVGGFFSQANGAARGGLAILNPTTGANAAGYNTMIFNHLSGEVPAVRSLDVQGSWLYVGGEFTHMTGGSVTSEVYTLRGGRISVSNGTPDASWNPGFNGSVISLDASSQGDRVYFAGFFSMSNSSTAVKGAVISTTGATDIPWSINFPSAANYQQGILEVGSRVWITGSEHMMYSFDRASLQQLSTNIGDTGGDGQAIATDGSVVYGGCHCFWTEYAGATTWPNIGSTWTQAYKINGVGAWNASSGAPMPQFSPTLSQRHGAGSWALFIDSTGKLWTGGDYSGSTKVGFVSQWSGGFVRFPLNDHASPTTPSGLSVSAGTSGDAVSWSGSTDNSGSVSYQVLRNDRVVAVTSGTGVTLPSAPAGTKYFVRAADAAGNWSASTAAVTATTAPTTQTLIAGGSTWSYYFNTTDPAPGFQAPAYDSSTWATGPAPIGFGQAVLGTTLTAPDPKPLTAYYRKSITVADASKVASVLLTTRADDGIVVYVNGTEVLRRNIDPGAVTSGTYANVAVSASNAVANPVTLTLPGSAFVTGTNVITAEVHSNYRSTPSASFELTAQATLQ
jgi:hypothetical protein